MAETILRGEPRSAAEEGAFALLAEALTNPPPWLQPYSPLARQVLDAARSRSVADALNAARSADSAFIRFVDHAELPAGEAYETFISRTACVPTRENLHDLFNGLMWLDWPHTKRRLNALQAGELSLRGTAGPRGVLRDALTLFDENAAVLQAPPELVGALHRRDWHTLFVTQRAQWQSARLVIFGHALLEKLLQPRKQITTHVWVVEELADNALAASLTSERLTAKLFLPLPVLGVPGWWSDNEAAHFYEDATVFRSGRSG